MVGDCTIDASPEKETTPIFTLSLCLSTNARAAAFAASMRFGFISSASIDPDTSMARMTVPSWLGTATTACGRATAIAMKARAKMKRTGGTWRRQPGPLPMASRTSERFAYRSA